MLSFLVRLLLSPPPLNIPPSGQHPSILPRVHLSLGPRSSSTPRALRFLPGLQYAPPAPCQSGCPGGHTHHRHTYRCDTQRRHRYLPVPYFPPLNSPPFSSDLRATGRPFPPRGFAHWSTSLPKTEPTLSLHLLLTGGPKPPHRAVPSLLRATPTAQASTHHQPLQDGASPYLGRGIRDAPSQRR